MKNFILPKNSLSGKKVLRIIITIVLIVLVLTNVNAQIIPHEISYQGKLLESGNPFNGTKTITFTIGTWSETHSNVPINNGLYSVKLGSVNPIPAEIFDDNPTATLIIEIDGSALSPYTDIVSVGYAFKSLYADTAHNAEKLGGQTSAYYQMGISNNSNSINNHISNYYNPHNVSKYDVGLGNVKDINIENGFTLDEGKYIATDIIKARNTANGLKLLDYNNTGIIIESGKVGIGITQTPSERLEVNGNIKANAYYDRNNPSYYLKFNSPNISFMVNGKVGIGTTSPGYKLDVIGDINFTGNLYQNGSLFSGISGSGSVNKLAIWNSSTNLTSSVLLHWNSAYNRLGVNEPNPQYTLDVGGQIGLLDYIYHTNDNDTYIKFSNNKIKNTASEISFYFHNAYNYHFVMEDWYSYYGGSFRPSSSGTGYLGTSSYKWYNIYALYSYIDYSKSKLSYELAGTKVNNVVKSNENLLSDINKLDAVLSSPDENGSEDIFAFDAQQLLSVFPQLVIKDKDNDNYYINYTRLIPVLVEAIKEQQQQIEDLKTEINKIKSNSN